jgi:hypothetical protein
MASMQKITPNLWFDTEAEEAANFYISIFDDSRIVNVSHYLEAGPRPAGDGVDRDLPARGSGVHGAEWGAAVQVQRGHLVVGQLRESGRGRRAVGEAFGRWRRRPAAG